MIQIIYPAYFCDDRTRDCAECDGHCKQELEEGHGTRRVPVTLTVEEPRNASLPPLIRDAVNGFSGGI